MCISSRRECSQSVGLRSTRSSEFLAQALLQEGVGRVLVVSYCDHDVVGYDRPLRAHGALRVVTWGIHADRFTPEEIERVADPIRTTGPPNYVSRMERWLRETGGTRGQALALHADALQPFDRVREALRAVLGPR